MGRPSSRLKNSFPFLLVLPFQFNTRVSQGGQINQRQQATLLYQEFLSLSTTSSLSSSSSSFVSSSSTQICILSPLKLTCTCIPNPFYPINFGFYPTLEISGDISIHLVVDISAGKTNALRWTWKLPKVKKAHCKLFSSFISFSTCLIENIQLCTLNRH